MKTNWQDSSSVWTKHAQKSLRHHLMEKKQLLTRIHNAILEADHNSSDRIELPG